MITNGIGRRVAKNDRSARNAQNVLHGSIGDVRDVDHHADAVHLEHDPLAELGEAFVRVRVVLRSVDLVLSGPWCVAVVRECHVANA